jgi:hypothetical protein
MGKDPLSLKEILARVLPNYIRVLPEGLELSPGDVLKNMEAKILSWTFARTRYINRKPTCRSLNGIRPLKQNCVCASCDHRPDCTPQICLDLIHPSGVCRFLLAFTSMRNFLLFLNEIPKEKGKGEGMNIELKVINRGRWGEVRFRRLEN